MSNMNNLLYIINSNSKKKIDGVGVKVMEHPEIITGVFYYQGNVKGLNKFLDDVMDSFGGIIRLYSADYFPKPGLACKMMLNPKNYRNVNLRILKNHSLYGNLSDLVAMDPEPIIHLNFNKRKNYWDYKTIPELSCINSNYNYIPN